MTLDECYLANQGKAILIPGGGAGNEGQCLQWVETVTHDVYGIPYIYTAGAIDFWNKFDELGLGQWFNKITDGSVKKGDVVVFNTKVGSIYGHIDVAMQDGTTDKFEGSDSNWGGNKTVHLVVHNGSQYVLGSLRLKGGTMDVPNDGDIINAKQFSTGVPTYQPTGEEFRFFKDPANGWKALLYDTIDGGKVQVENAKKTKYEQVPFPVFKEK